MTVSELLVLVGVGAVAVAGGLAYAADRRADATKRQAAQNELLRTSPQSVLIPLREAHVTRMGDHERRAEAARKAAETAEASRAKWSTQFWRGKDPKLGFVIVVAVLTVAWIALFLLQRSMDITVMQALGSVMPQLFGNVIALVFAVLGILISGIAGLHHLLPSWMEPQRRAPRVLIAGGLLVVSAMFMTKISDTAQYRSDDRFSAAVSQDSGVIAQLQAEKPTAANQVQVAIEQRQLQQDQQRLDSAKSLDKTLTLLVLPAEMALSAFPIFAVELASIGMFGLAARRHRRRERTEIAERAGIPQQFRQEAATMLARADPAITSPRIDAILSSLQSLQAEPADGEQRVSDQYRQTEPPAQRPSRPDATSTGANSVRIAQTEGGLGDVRFFGPVPRARDVNVGREKTVDDHPASPNPDDDQPWAFV